MKTQAQPEVKLSARWCPLCGTQHAVEQGRQSPWSPDIKRYQIEAFDALLSAAKRVIEQLNETGTVNLLEGKRLEAEIKKAENK